MLPPSSSNSILVYQTFLSSASLLHSLSTEHVHNQCKIVRRLFPIQGASVARNDTSRGERRLLDDSDVNIAKC